MEAFEVPGVAKAYWEPELRTLRVEWFSFMSSAGFREAMTRSVAECAARRALAWIADTRETRGVLRMEDQRFMVDYMPITRQSGIRAIITVKPRNVLTDMSNRRWQRQVMDPNWSIVEVNTLDEAWQYCRSLLAVAA